MSGRTLLSLSGIAAAMSACAGGPSPTGEPLPDWRGPAVHCRHLAGGGLTVELTAPTAGHTFRVVDVRAREQRVDVLCAHSLPAADFVAQVVTPHEIEVPAKQLGDARAVWIWVATGGTEPRLAIATARP